MAEEFKTPVGMLSFPQLFTAKEKGGVKGADLVYSASLVFDKAAQKTPAFQKLQAAVEAARAKLAKENKVTLSKVDNPIRDGDDKAKYEGYAGNVYISAKSKFKPAVVDPDKQPILDSDDVWAGQKARFNVSLYSWVNAGKIGVSLNLNGVHVVDMDAERMDGRKTGADMFNDDEDEMETI